MIPPGEVRRPAAARAAGLLLVGAFVALCAHGLRWDSPTVDEFAHLPAGYYYLRTGNFELYDLNPPLPRVWSALPLLAVAPSIDTGARLRDDGWYPWVFATDFMRRNGARLELIFLLGRLPVVALGGLLLLLVWHWARRLYGEGAGLVALAGCAFCPSLIAHAHLATTDVACALGAAGALYLAQRWIERPRLPGLLAAGVALGLAQLTKFSAVLLYPVLLLLAAAALARQQWWRAALWLALPVLVKVTPLAVALLFCALWPRRLTARFVLLLGLGLLVPFLTKSPDAVLGHYAEWAQHLTRSADERWLGFRDGWTVWVVCRHFIFGEAGELPLRGAIDAPWYR
ncbi:MAG TPA: glycosyltransferase family 39 protein, partial [Thermoanaerobaculia bacterium]|nr:glycosyltransferase family 39 protein [Thermoanaerobaculia bacterium]